MNIEFVLLGTYPLLMHNPQLVDPDFPIVREIKALTAKKKKTDEDLRQIESLEWHGGLYTGEIAGRIVVVQPTSKVRKSLIGAARVSKQGRQVERAVMTTAIFVPLHYEGSDRAKDHEAEVARLFGDPAYRSKLSVGVNGKRVMRVRPQFKQWALVVPAVFIPDAGLNFDELVRIAELAGTSERIGDNRVNGYGAYRGHVREVNARTRPVEPSLAGVRRYFDELDEKEAAA